MCVRGCACVSVSHPGFWTQWFACNATYHQRLSHLHCLCAFKCVGVSTYTRSPIWYCCSWMQQVSMGTMTSVTPRDFIHNAWVGEKSHFAMSGPRSLSSCEWFVWVEKKGGRLVPYIVGNWWVLKFCFIKNNTRHGPISELLSLSTASSDNKFQRDWTVINVGEVMLTFQEWQILTQCSAQLWNGRKIIYGL